MLWGECCPQDGSNNTQAPDCGRTDDYDKPINENWGKVIILMCCDTE